MRPSRGASGAFGDAVLPLYLPVTKGADVTGLLGLLSGTVSEQPAAMRCPRTGTPTTSNASPRRRRGAR